MAYTDPLSAKPVIATNKRFAEPANALYRNSQGHGNVDCGGCKQHLEEAAVVIDQPAKGAEVDVTLAPR